MNILILLQTAVAFVIGIVSLFLVYKLLNIYLKRVFQIETVNSAYATLQAGILLSTAMLVSSIIGPGLNAIRFLNQDAITVQSVAGSMGYVMMFLIIGMIFSFIIIASGILILFQLTHVNEWEEIRNNNIATAIISAALILGLALIMKDHVASVCEMLIPYPQVMQIR
jgi:uncharacterized membrane protein YjfL (UPF0719 family)